MPTYHTPGVYVEEISKFPPSVAAVATAIPAFIGYTNKHEDDEGNSLLNIPTKIKSLLEFEELFGKPEATDMFVNIEQAVDADSNAVISTNVTFTPEDLPNDILAPPAVPVMILYYTMQWYFAEGGGPCYIVSIGLPDNNGNVVPVVADFTGAVSTLEKFDEPTLLIAPGAADMAKTNALSVVSALIVSCDKLGDRFAICDVHKAMPGEASDDADVSEFRELTGGDYLKFGAAYYPFVRTKLPFLRADDRTTIVTITQKKTDGTESSTGTAAAPAGLLSAFKDPTDALHDSIVSNAVESFLSEKARVVLPPSGGVAGIYCRVDKNRGVWKAPANEGFYQAIEPVIAITDAEQADLNVHTTGKSVNAIRAFTGKGTLVWGARTLLGNDNENRYVPVRRFLNFAEESIKKACAGFVFEPNDANTWVKVRSMIENFLILQWRDGALAGAKPEHAFYVKVGLNETMSATDILEGRMIVEIGLAIVRPAEFIILRFSQLMQKS